MALDLETSEYKLVDGGSQDTDLCPMENRPRGWHQPCCQALSPLPQTGPDTMTKAACTGQGPCGILQSKLRLPWVHDCLHWKHSTLPRSLSSWAVVHHSPLRLVVCRLPLLCPNCIVKRDENGRFSRSAEGFGLTLECGDELTWQWLYSSIAL